MAKFTFKTEKSSGRFRSFYSDYHIIKLNKKHCGTIQAEAPHRITLMVIKSEEDLKKPNNNPNCSWKHITLAREFESVLAAKAWLSENSDKVQKQFNIFIDND